MAKRTYLTAEFIYAAPTVKGFQEIEDGSVTGYFAEDGQPMAEGFLSCAVGAETKPPKWARDVTAPNVSGDVLAQIAALPDEKQKELVEKIAKLVEEAQADV